MARAILLLAVLLFAAAANTHAVKVTITVEEPTPQVTPPPKPSVTLPPKPSMTLPPKPSTKLPPKPSAKLPPKPSVTLPPKPSAKLPPKPSAKLPPKPSVTLPPKPSATLPPKPSAMLPPKRSATLPPKPSATLPPKPSATLPPKPSATLPPKPSATLPPKPSVTLPPKPSVTLPPKPSATLAPKPSVALPPSALPKEEAVVKVLVRNTCTRELTIKVAELGSKVQQLVAKPGKWQVCGVFKVSAQKNQVLEMSVTVKNDKGVNVTKPLALELLKRFKTELKGKKYVVLKAVEDTKTGVTGQKEKLLNLWMDAQVALTINLTT